MAASTETEALNFLKVANSWAQARFHPDEYGHCEFYVMHAKPPFPDAQVGRTTLNGITKDDAVIGGISDEWERERKGCMNFARAYLIELLGRVYPGSMRIQSISVKEFWKWGDDPEFGWDESIKANGEGVSVLYWIKNHIKENKFELKLKAPMWTYDKAQHLEVPYGDDLAIDLEPFLEYGFDDLSVTGESFTYDT
ncbi:unnamed protein product [Periconia digitata]|uniref:Uncharacterized protein n=1 Tax=Periconia digitata TaxID=1303443 RepID=A0A9W4U7I8_9PLEO|nr:unnamed protein product [Periconia digitata]